MLRLGGRVLNAPFSNVQVKAEKHTSRSCFDDDDGYCSSPRTPGFIEETAFSLVRSISSSVVCFRNYATILHDECTETLVVRLFLLRLVFDLVIS
jgi:hypothetical protein